MRLNVGLKLGFWLALFGITSSALTGYYAYTKSRDLLTKSAEEKLLTATQVLARRINFSVEQIVNDVNFIAALPMAQQLAEPSIAPAARAAQHRQLEDIFSSLLVSHPEYFQVRVIGIANNGRELIRVDRGVAGIMPVRGEDLQEKGHFPYVYEALKLDPDDLYFSRINLNREQGANQGLNKPTLRIAATLRSKWGEVFGIIVINVDLGNAFKRIRTDLPDDINVMLTNEEGDYLVHPDISKTFGFDQGRRVQIQNEIEATRPMLARRKNNVVLTVDDNENGGQAVAAFVRVPFGSMSDPRFLLVGLVTPLEKVVLESRVLGLNIIQIALILSLLALAISFLLSRFLTRPLHAIASAVAQFEAGKPVTGLPLGRTDEIGLLAKTFLSMTSKLSSQVGDLQNRQLQLDYIAHHDQLTRLPNRVLFLDRLIQSINKAHRNSRQFAVMFLDLDKFKEINDTLGHHVGDQVLKGAALRMQSIMREEDTISRLGGDEFTIIIEDTTSTEQIEQIASRLIDLFNQPYLVDSQSFLLTCSIGISIYPQHGLQAEELLNNADAAMYLAKNSGRNNYQVFGTLVQEPDAHAAEQAPLSL
jgi:diguanylate cyclase